MPRSLVCDQARESINVDLETFYRGEWRLIVQTGVQAPWAEMAACAQPLSHVDVADSGF